MTEPSQGPGHYWRHHRRHFTGGLILIVLGVIFLLNNLNYLNVDWNKYWPVLLIALGVWIVIQRMR